MGHAAKAVRAVEILFLRYNPRKTRTARKPPIAKKPGKTALFWSGSLNGVQEAAGSSPVAPMLRKGTFIKK